MILEYIEELDDISKLVSEINPIETADEDIQIIIDELFELSHLFSGKNINQDIQ